MTGNENFLLTFMHVTCYSKMIFNFYSSYPVIPSELDENPVNSNKRYCLLRDKYIEMFGLLMELQSEKLIELALQGFQKIIAEGETEFETRYESKFPMAILAIISQNLYDKTKTNQILIIQIISDMIKLYPHHFEPGKIIQTFRLLTQTYEIVGDLKIRKVIRINIQYMFVNYTNYTLNHSEKMIGFDKRIDMLMLYLAEDCNYYTIKSSNSPLPCVFEAFTGLLKVLPSHIHLSSSFIDTLWKDICPSITNIFATYRSISFPSLVPSSNSVSVKYTTNVNKKDHHDPIDSIDFNTSYQSACPPFSKPEYYHCLYDLVFEIIRLGVDFNSLKLMIRSMFHEMLSSSLAFYSHSSPNLSSPTTYKNSSKNIRDIKKNRNRNGFKCLLRLFDRTLFNIVESPGILIKISTYDWDKGTCDISYQGTFNFDMSLVEMIICFASSCVTVSTNKSRIKDLTFELCSKLVNTLAILRHKNLSEYFDQSELTFHDLESKDPAKSQSESIHSIKSDSSNSYHTLSDSDLENSNRHKDCPDMSSSQNLIDDSYYHSDSDNDLEIRDIFDFEIINSAEKCDIKKQKLDAIAFNSKKEELINEANCSNHESDAMFLGKNNGENSDSRRDIIKVQDVLVKILEEVKDKCLNEWTHGLRNSIEIDISIINYCSLTYRAFTEFTYTPDILERRYANRKPLFNSDFLYFAIYRILILNLNLKRAKFYQDNDIDHKSIIPTLDEFIGYFERYITVMVYPRDWLAKLYNFTLQHDLLINNDSNSALVNVIMDMNDFQNQDLHNHTQTLSEYRNLQPYNHKSDYANRFQFEGQTFVKHLLKTKCQNILSFDIQNESLKVLWPPDSSESHTLLNLIMGILDIKPLFTCLVARNPFKNGYVCVNIPFVIRIVETLQILSEISLEIDNYECSLKITIMLAEYMQPFPDYLLSLGLPHSNEGISDSFNLSNVPLYLYILYIITNGYYIERATRFPSLWIPILKCCGIIVKLHAFFTLPNNCLPPFLRDIRNTLLTSRSFHRNDISGITTESTSLTVFDHLPINDSLRYSSFLNRAQLIQMEHENYDNDAKVNADLHEIIGFDLAATSLVINDLKDKCDKLFTQCYRCLNLVSLCHFTRSLTTNSLNTLKMITLEDSKNSIVKSLTPSKTNKQFSSIKRQIGLNELKFTVDQIKVCLYICINSGRPLYHVLDVWMGIIFPYYRQCIKIGWQIGWEFIKTIFEHNHFLVQSFLSNHAENIGFHINQLIFDFYRQFLILNLEEPAGQSALSKWLMRSDDLNLQLFEQLDAMITCDNNDHINIDDIGSGWKSIFTMIRLINPLNFDFTFLFNDTANKINFVDPTPSSIKQSVRKICYLIINIIHSFYSYCLEERLNNVSKLAKSSNIFLNHYLDVFGYLNKLLGYCFNRLGSLIDGSDNQNIFDLLRHWTHLLKLYTNRYLDYTINNAEFVETCFNRNRRLSFLDTKTNFYEPSLNFEHILNVINTIDVSPNKLMTEDYDDVFIYKMNFIDHNPFSTYLPHKNTNNAYKSVSSHSYNYLPSYLSDWLAEIIHVYDSLLLLGISQPLYLENHDIYHSRNPHITYNYSNGPHCSKDEKEISSCTRIISYFERKIMSKITGSSNCILKKWTIEYLYYGLFPTLGYYIIQNHCVTANLKLLKNSILNDGRRKNYKLLLSILTNLVSDILLDPNFIDFTMKQGIFESMLVIYLDILLLMDYYLSTISISLLRHFIFSLLNGSSTLKKILTSDNYDALLKQIMDVLRLSLYLIAHKLSAFIGIFKPHSWNMKGNESFFHVTLGVKTKSSTESANSYLDNNLTSVQMGLIKELLYNEDFDNDVIEFDLKVPTKSLNVDRIIYLHIDGKESNIKFDMYVEEFSNSILSLFLITQLIGDIGLDILDCPYILVPSFQSDSIFTRRVEKNENKDFQNYQYIPELISLLADIYHMSSAFDRRPGMKLLLKRCLQYDFPTNSMPNLYKINSLVLAYYGLLTLYSALHYENLKTENFFNSKTHAMKNMGQMLAKFLDSLYSFSCLLNKEFMNSSTLFKEDTSSTTKEIIRKHESVTFATIFSDLKLETNNIMPIPSTKPIKSSRSTPNISKNSYGKSFHASIDDQNTSKTNFNKFCQMNEPSASIHDDDDSITSLSREKFNNPKNCLENLGDQPKFSSKNYQLIHSYLVTLLKDTQIHKKIWNLAMIQFLTLFARDFGYQNLMKIKPFIMPVVQMYYNSFQQTADVDGIKIKEYTCRLYQMLTED
ncbi:uncharacterized protein LOC135927995 isoform X3 [Gordionus sp. m RMFG-2023]|uniref:uncharacterized protein LOC135927995 isoform X3 n=1 Tax=Gordionus sp. m RMFG-2023 TaxID=3053472 RepID=UPI0031FC93D9